LAILAERQPIKLDDLAGRLGVNKSATYRLLRVLQEEHYAERISGGGYQVGPALIGLTAITMPKTPYYASSYPILRQLAESTEETITLHRRVGDLSILVFGVESERHVLRQVPRIGEACPIVRGCSALAILAFLQPAEIDSVLRRATLSESEGSLLRSRLANIAEQGFSTSHGENHPGIRGVAVTVPPEGVGNLQLSVTMAGPADRWTMERALGFVDELKRCGRALADHFATTHA
jgi:DNA-binding IclR family transcriptional regulator